MNSIEKNKEKLIESIIRDAKNISDPNMLLEDEDTSVKFLIASLEASANDLDFVGEERRDFIIGVYEFYEENLDNNIWLEYKKCL